MRDTFLPFAPPSLGEEEIEEVVDTLRSDWITTGPKVKQFEEAFARSTDSPAALAVNSCTAALHLSLLAFGIGPGDIVVTTPMTFCSTVNVIEHVGAQPLLVDIESDTLNIDPELVRAAVAGAAGRAKAIIGVHYGGHPFDMSALYTIAAEQGCFVVEDAAHAYPAYFDGRIVGKPVHPDVPSTVCFSFYATKNLTTAEGGMLVGDPDLVDRARVWSLHGMSRDAWKRYEAGSPWFYEVVRPGFKYNMTDIQAALGIQQLRRIDDFSQRRQAIAKRYTEAFSALSELQPPTERGNVTSAWHLYVIRINKNAIQIGRDAFIDELRNRNIGSSVHFIPVHLHPYYRGRYGYRPEDFPVALREYERMISLPIHPRLSDEDVDDVIEAVTSIVSQHRR